METPGQQKPIKTDRQRNEKISRKFENEDLEVLHIHDEDLRPFIINIFRSDLGCLKKLKTLKLERCQLDIFAPKELSDKLVNVSLEGNKLDKLEAQFGYDKVDYELEDVKIETLNLSSNQFKIFPYKSLKTSPKLIVFESLRELDLSSNNLDMFPVNIKDCPKLQKFRAIYNKIQTIPNEFYQSESMQEHLTDLILNVNPLTELSGLIRYLKNLRVLGIAHTKIQELPPQIANLQNMKQIVVENTPLRVPKLVCAERGFEAIKEFFMEQRQRNQETNLLTTYDDRDEHNQSQNNINNNNRSNPMSQLLQKQNTSKLNDSDEEDEDSSNLLNEEKKFQDYELKKNKLVSKEFAYAVIEEMKKKQDIDLYDPGVLEDFKDKEHEFVQAYDQVLKNYIQQDKLNMLPDFFKQNQLVKQIKDSRRAVRFDFPAIQAAGSTEDQQSFAKKLDSQMIDNSLNRVIALIRFQNFELYKILIELINKMDIYKLKFVITYVTTYLDEFLLLCDLKAQIDPKMISFKDEFDIDMQERKKETYEIDINNQIFYQKIGQHPQLMQLFSLLNFKKEMSKQHIIIHGDNGSLGGGFTGVVKLRADKTESNYRAIKAINQLLKLLQSVQL
eukprot:403348034